MPRQKYRNQKFIPEIQRQKFAPNIRSENVPNFPAEIFAPKSCDFAPKLKRESFFFFFFLIIKKNRFYLLHFLLFRNFFLILKLATGFCFFVTFK